MKVKINCLIHGIFEQKPNDHLNGKGCKKCQHNSYRDTFESVVTKANKAHNSKYHYPPFNYTNSSDKIKIICPIHGPFNQIIRNHLHGAGCSICRSSKGELEVIKALEEKRITYIPQKVFDNCKGKRHKLPFDFYLPQYNVCIEYQGRQHFTPVDIFGVEEFKRTQETDHIKATFCVNEGINLIIIRHDENTKEKLLTSLFNPYNVEHVQ